MKNTIAFAASALCAVSFVRDTSVETVFAQDREVFVHDWMWMMNFADGVFGAGSVP